MEVEIDGYNKIFTHWCSIAILSLGTDLLRGDGTSLCELSYVPTRDT